MSFAHSAARRHTPVDVEAGVEAALAVSTPYGGTTPAAAGAAAALIRSAATAPSPARTADGVLVENWLQPEDETNEAGDDVTVGSGGLHISAAPPSTDGNTLATLMTWLESRQRGLQRAWPMLARTALGSRDSGDGDGGGMAPDAAYETLSLDGRGALVARLLCTHDGRRLLYHALAEEWHKQLFFFLADVHLFVRRSLALDALRRLAALEEAATARSPSRASGTDVASEREGASPHAARRAVMAPPADHAAARLPHSHLIDAHAVRGATPTTESTPASSPATVPPLLANPALRAASRQHSGGGRRRAGTTWLQRPPRRRPLRSMLMLWVVSGDAALATIYARYFDRRSPLYIAATPATIAAVEAAVATARTTLRAAAAHLSAPSHAGSSGISTATLGDAGDETPPADPLARVLPADVLVRLAQLRHVFAAAVVELVVDISGATLAGIMARPEYGEWRSTCPATLLAAVGPMASSPHPPATPIPTLLTVVAVPNAGGGGGGGGGGGTAGDAGLRITAPTSAPPRLSHSPAFNTTSEYLPVVRTSPAAAAVPAAGGPPTPPLTTCTAGAER